MKNYSNVAMISLGLVISMFLSSCEKENELGIQTNVNPPKCFDEVIIMYKEGHIFILEGNRWKWTGTYTRDWFQEVLDCEMADAMCLPTVYINAPAPPIKYRTELLRTIDETNKDYGDALKFAVLNGIQAVKDWYFNQGGNTWLDFNAEIEDDLQNEITTIKSFLEGYYLVYIDAITYDDCPNYF